MTQPRHVKAFIKDDKIVFEINEKEMPNIDKYSSTLYFHKALSEWESHNKYIEGAKEQLEVQLWHLLYPEYKKSYAEITNKIFDEVVKQGILIDPSLIEERDGFIYLKETKSDNCPTCGSRVKIHTSPR